MDERLTVGKLIKLLSKYNKDNFVQLDFDTSNLNIRDKKYNGRQCFMEAEDTICLPTEYEYRPDRKE